MKITRPARRVSPHRTLAVTVILLALAAAAAGFAQPAMGASANPYWLIGSWGGPGTGDGQLSNTFDLAVSSDGARVYVADAGNTRVQYFKANGTYQGQWGTAGRGWGAFQYPTGIGVSPDGTRVYVTDSADARVQYFDTAGTFLGQWTTPGTAPCSIAFSPDGTRAYVADISDNTITYSDLAGNAGGSWGGSGTDAGLFGGPRGVTVAPDGTVYVADLMNHRIQYFEPDGAYLGQWGSIISGASGLDRPFDVAVGADGVAVVTDTLFERVQCYAGGVFSGPLGSYGSGPGQFGVPCTVAFAPDGTLYVGDASLRRIQYFRHDVAPPVTIDDTPAAWSKVPVTVILTPTDDLSGAVHTFWQIDGGAWTDVLGTGAVAPIPAAPTERHIPVLIAGDGVHTFELLLKRQRPQHRDDPEPHGAHRLRAAPSGSRQRRERRARQDRPSFVISSTTPPARPVPASIKIFTARGRLVKTINVAGAQSNRTLTASFRCTLAKGVYRWKLYATDLAGNAQAQPSVRRLTVR